ncbi:MAG: YlxR family protein [Desulfovibrio sp.]|jgi:predicted RNA-binding protein YlxR (DUF448 family)|nr:YlxR family protein [Desulfovibrio sp.]
MRAKQSGAELEAAKLDGPLRMCVVCRRRFAKNALRRYVCSPQGSLVFDPKKSAHGRGIYLCSDPRCGTKFVKYRPDAKRKGKKHA